EHSIADMIESERGTARLTRRGFSALGLGAGLTMLLPPVANAAEVTESRIRITTPDGTADAYFVHPASGSHPAVLIWADALGLRPAFEQMATRLAQSGYAVLVPNPFYRSRPAPIAPPGARFSDPEVRKNVM